ncbi:hypothetical protein FHS27_005365 [Rhodopirellula rubra]|uniref:Uncharacterized protein n=1 Tax=Aporhodopirellula rubra TaxID=980271 RepID=A0A7W5E3H4_9BACT|nr:hypothetical protein [Aporhodopirellula rubra]
MGLRHCIGVTLTMLARFTFAIPHILSPSQDSMPRRPVGMEWKSIIAKIPRSCLFGLYFTMLGMRPMAVESRFLIAKGIFTNADGTCASLVTL